jgi:hypothetical protein
VDPLREPRRLVEGVLHGTAHLGEEGGHRSGVVALRLAGELQAHSESDQVLMDPVVQVTLDRATIGIRRQDEPSARRAKLIELHAQSVELSLHIDLPSLQRDRLPPLDVG